MVRCRPRSRERSYSCFASAAMNRVSDVRDLGARVTCGLRGSSWRGRTAGTAWWPPPSPNAERGQDAPSLPARGRQRWPVAGGEGECTFFRNACLISEGVEARSSPKVSLREWVSLCSLSGALKLTSDPSVADAERRRKSLKSGAKFESRWRVQSRRFPKLQQTGPSSSGTRGECAIVCGGKERAYTQTRGGSTAHLVLAEWANRQCLSSWQESAKQEFPRIELRGFPVEERESRRNSKEAERRRLASSVSCLPPFPRGSS